MPNFTSFNQHNDTFAANVNRTELKNLPAGSYRLEFDQQTSTLYFNKFQINYDALIDLPSPEYQEVMREVNTFLLPETRGKFADYGYLYKRSELLYGPPGTGKTCIINRVSEKVIAAGGVIIFNPHPGLLEMAFKILDDIQPNVMTMVIFEEFEQVLERFEDEMLSLLDGEIQKNNVMYLATTNHIDRIPARLKRPGRFATILEVKYPNADARAAYLQRKLKEEDFGLIPTWVSETDGLSVDELKETVVSVKCLGLNLPEVVQRIRTTKQAAQEAEEVSSVDWDAIAYGDDGGLGMEILRQQQQRAKKATKKRY